MKQYVLDYYRMIRENQGQYHRHKENMAWAAVVLHIALCFGITEIDKATTVGWGNVLKVVIVVILTIATLTFVKQQLRFKKIAERRVAFAQEIIREVSIKPDSVGLKRYLEIKRKTDKDRYFNKVFPDELVGRFKKKEMKYLRESLAKTIISVILAISILAIIVVYV